VFTTLDSPVIFDGKFTAVLLKQNLDMGSADLLVQTADTCCRQALCIPGTDRYIDHIRCRAVACMCIITKC
jgi:hypothetical protein